MFLSLLNKKFILSFLILYIIFPVFSLQLGDGTTENQFLPKKIMENVIQVCATDFNTFVLTNDGTVFGTGLNINGILGNNSTKESNEFVKILSDVKKISATDNTAIFLKKDGTVWLTGRYYNSNKQENKKSPFLIQSDVIDILAVESSVFYIKKDNSLWGFGQNLLGEMGLSTTTPEYSPIKIASNVKNFISTNKLAFESLYGAKYCVNNKSIKVINKDAIYISSNLILYQDNKLFGKGFAAYGALGIGEPKNHILESETFVLENVLIMESNDYHSLIVTNEGKLYSCGGAGGNSESTYSSFGFIGDGTTSPCLTPVLILENIQFVAVGSYTSFAIDKNGILYGWGLNNADEMLLYY